MLAWDCSCGARNPVSAAVCPACLRGRSAGIPAGESLQPTGAAPTCPRCRTPMGLNNQFCPTCKRDLSGTRGTEPAPRWTAGNPSLRPRTDDEPSATWRQLVHDLEPLARAGPRQVTDTSQSSVPPPGSVLRPCGFCGHPTSIYAVACPACASSLATIRPAAGTTRRADGQPRAALGNDPAPTGSVANAGLIAAMWVFTGLEIIISVSQGAAGFGLAFIVDIPAFIMAIVLVCSRNGTDKGNGWAKIALEMIGFLAGYLAVTALRR
jgi:hypothetical protein